MPAPSLLMAARRACVKNIRSINDVGDAPYDVVRPVLLKLENPEQLKQLEEMSPQMIGRDDEIWLEFIKRDIEDWETKPHRPKNPANWYKVYKKLLRENEIKIKKDAALLRATMEGLNKEKSQHKLQRVELASVKPLKGMQRTDPIIKLGKKLQMRQRPSGNTTSGPFLKQAATEQELDVDKPKPAVKRQLDRILKGPQGLNHFQHHQKTPKATLSPRDVALKSKPTTNTIVKAPRGMVEEHKMAAVAKPIDTSIQRPAMFNPRKRKIEHVDDPKSNVASSEEREKRLKAFTNPSAIPKPSPSIKPPRAQVLTPTASPSSPAAKDEPLLVPPIDTKDLTDILSPPSSNSTRSLSPAYRVARANTSSPANGGARPPMKMKGKAPVDIFMRPRKRQQRA